MGTKGPYGLGTNWTNRGKNLGRKDPFVHKGPLRPRYYFRNTQNLMQHLMTSHILLEMIIQELLQEPHDA